jgi:hypothetical protein
MTSAVAHLGLSYSDHPKVLWQWLMAKPGQPLPTALRPISAPQGSVAPFGADTASLSSLPHTAQTDHSTTHAMRPLRVLQVMELGANPSQSGRLRISGRMADVCAELDRLAAREALQH